MKKGEIVTYVSPLDTKVEGSKMTKRIRQEVELAEYFLGNTDRVKIRMPGTDAEGCEVLIKYLDIDK